MKIDIWPDDVSMPEMSDWLAGLRDDGRGEPPRDGYAGAAPRPRAPAAGPRRRSGKYPPQARPRQGRSRDVFR